MILHEMIYENIVQFYVGMIHMMKNSLTAMACYDSTWEGIVVAARTMTINTGSEEEVGEDG